MRYPTAKPINQFPCFLGESIYERLEVVLCVTTFCRTTLVLPILLLAFAALFVWWTLRWRSEVERSTPKGKLLQQQFRKWRNQRAEEEMARCLMELGWPKAGKRMTAEEVTRQLCNRLADWLWNHPNAD